MAITKVENINGATKVTDNNSGTTYTWLYGRFLIAVDNDTITIINDKLAPEDQQYKQVLTYSNQTEVYSTTTAEEFVEYLIANEIFFSKIKDVVVTNTPLPTAESNLPLPTSPQESFQIGKLFVPFSDVGNLVRAGVDLDGATAATFETLESAETEYSVPSDKNLVVAVTIFSTSTKESFSFGYADDAIGTNYVEILSETSLGPQNNYSGETEFLYVIPSLKFPIAQILKNMTTGYLFIEALENPVQIQALSSNTSVSNRTTLDPFLNLLHVDSVSKTEDEVIVRFNKVSDSTTLAVAGTIGDKTIELTSVAGEAAGKYIILFNPASRRFTPFFQVGAAAGNVITIDGPLDFDYPVGTSISLSDTNLAVDGSVTPQIFGLRGTGAPPGVNVDFHMTRIVMTCLADTLVDLSRFGDLTELTNGIQFRSRNGRFKNSFNIKSNREINSIFGGGWRPHVAINPSQGQDGFTATLNFAGPDNYNVVKSMPIGTDFEAIVQDDLVSAQGNSKILVLEIYAAGYIIEP